MEDEKKEKEKKEKISVTNTFICLERRKKEIVREVHPIYYHFRGGPMDSRGVKGSRGVNGVPREFQGCQRGSRGGGWGSRSVKEFT